MNPNYTYIFHIQWITSVLERLAGHLPQPSIWIRRQLKANLSQLNGFVVNKTLEVWGGSASQQASSFSQ